MKTQGRFRFSFTHPHPHLKNGRADEKRNQFALRCTLSMSLNGLDRAMPDCTAIRREKRNQRISPNGHYVSHGDALIREFHAEIESLGPEVGVVDAGKRTNGADEGAVSETKGDLRRVEP